MLATQVTISFLIWIAYGALMMRRSRRTREWALRHHRSGRAIGGALLMLIGPLGAFSALYGASRLHFGDSSGFTTLGWLAITVVGAAFVHVEVLATSLLVTLANPEITQVADATSNKQSSPEKHDD